jgi:hypothetical protein
MSYCWTVQLAPGDAAFQDSVTLLLVLLVDARPVGMLGSRLQLPAGSVVTDSGPLWAEALPALSRARTRKLNAVFAARPVAVKLVAVGEPTMVPFWNTSYPATPLPPELSVEAFHDSDTLVLVFDGDDRAAGTLGAVVSPAPQVPMNCHQPQAGQKFGGTFACWTIA